MADEESESVDAPAQPDEESESTDAPAQPDEESESVDAPSQPDDESESTDAPAQPDEESESADVPIQPDEESESTDVPIQSDEESVSANVPTQSDEESESADAPVICRTRKRRRTGKKTSPVCRFNPPVEVTSLSKARRLDVLARRRELQRKQNKIRAPWSPASTVKACTKAREDRSSPPSNPQI